VKGGRASKGFAGDNCFEKQRILTPRSQLKFLHMFLAITIFHDPRRGSIEVGIGMFAIESRKGCVL
jgi:hypothetical protein